MKRSISHQQKYINNNHLVYDKESKSYKSHENDYYLQTDKRNEFIKNDRRSIDAINLPSGSYLRKDYACETLNKQYTNSVNQFDSGKNNFFFFF